MIGPMSPSQRERALQDRADKLRERQQAQRTALDKVPAALARVEAVREREKAQDEIEQQAARLAHMKRQAKELAAAQRRKLGGRAFGSLTAERDAAADVIAAAVAAFGSRAAAADALGVPQRTVSEYAARHARNHGQDLDQAFFDDGGGGTEPDDDAPHQEELPLA